MPKPLIVDNVEVPASYANFYIANDKYSHLVHRNPSWNAETSSCLLTWLSSFDDLPMPLEKLETVTDPSNHLLVNIATRISRVPTMDMTYQRTVRIVQIIVHMMKSRQYALEKEK